MVLKDRYRSPLSINTINVPMVLESQKKQQKINKQKQKKEKKRTLRIFAENMLIFKFSPLILGICYFDVFFSFLLFLLIVNH